MAENGLYRESFEGRAAVASKDQKKIEVPIDNELVLIP